MLRSLFQYISVMMTCKWHTKRESFNLTSRLDSHNFPAYIFARCDECLPFNLLLRPLAHHVTYIPTTSDYRKYSFIKHLIIAHMAWFSGHTFLVREKTRHQECHKRYQLHPRCRHLRNAQNHTYTRWYSGSHTSSRALITNETMNIFESQRTTLQQATNVLIPVPSSPRFADGQQPTASLGHWFALAASTTVVWVHACPEPL